MVVCCQKCVLSKICPSIICPILLLVENMSTLLLVENMSVDNLSVDNMSVENMTVEKTSRCPLKVCSFEPFVYTMCTAMLKLINKVPD